MYRLRLEPAQKMVMIERIRAIDEEGSSYNITGLLTKKSKLPNIMFCSQFVYSILDEAGLAYFEKKQGEVRPQDFIRRAGGLEFMGCLSFNPPDFDPPDFASAGGWNNPALAGTALPAGTSLMPLPNAP
jgi:hypothetical protein